MESLIIKNTSLQLLPTGPSTSRTLPPTYFSKLKQTPLATDGKVGFILRIGDVLDINCVFGLRVCEYKGEV
jgi:hypothetical protein